MQEQVISTNSMGSSNEVADKSSRRGGAMHGALKATGYAAGAAMLQAKKSQNQSGTCWVVKPGDTLWEIALKKLGFGSLWIMVWKANLHKIANPHALSPGCVLTIPDVTGGSAPAGVPTASTYTVRPGDSLSTIAARLLGDASRWQELWQANRQAIPNPNVISIGQILTLPGKTTEPLPETPAPLAPTPVLPTTTPSNNTYVVKSGDTLSKIAEQLLGSAGRWKDIWDANRHLIPNPNAIQVGQVLTIPGAQTTPGGPAPQPQTPKQDAPKPPSDDGSMAPDHGGLAVGATPLEQSMAAIYNSKGKLVQQQSAALGFEPAVGAAVLSVESGGSGHVDGKLKIRFEAHIFKNSSGGQYVSVLHSGKQSDEYAAFETAKNVDRDAAFESISMGAAQIMGFNAQRIGFSSAEAMFDEFQSSLSAQLVGMFEFVRTSNTLVAAARAKDWATFAYHYNGAGYAANAYDTKMANAYAAYKKVTRGLPFA